MTETISDIYSWLVKENKKILKERNLKSEKSFSYSYQDHTDFLYKKYKLMQKLEKKIAKLQEKEK